MKTHTLNIGPIEQTAPRTTSAVPVDYLRSILGLATRTFLAVVPAIGIVIGAAWLTMQAELAVYLQALLWASGFVFFGLALESERAGTAVQLLLTGLALPVLALMSDRVAIEIAVIAASLVALWVGAGIFARR
jgi:hypothetical protein